MSGEYTKKPKFSYSKLNTYDSCGWKYYLTYKLNKFIFSDNLASELGTLLHKVEQDMFNTLKKGEKIDYDKIKDFFYNANIPKRDKYDTDGGIYGINILKEKYKEDYYETDNMGQSYDTKITKYLETGIYRLEDFLNDNHNIVPFEAEKFFSFSYNGYTLSGYIDRIFYDKERDKYLIEDIKTKGKPFKDDELTTPLQLVIYSLALNECLDINLDQIECFYDLPFLNLKQPAGTPGFVKRGKNKLDKIFSGINDENWEPHPSPLCHFCSYCVTNEEAPEEGKLLCPYFCKWTRENRTFATENKWKGLDSHEKIMEKFLAKYGDIKVEKTPDDEFDFDF